MNNQQDYRPYYMSVNKNFQPAHVIDIYQQSLEEQSEQHLFKKIVIPSILIVVLLSLLMLGGFVWFLSGVNIYKINADGDITLPNEFLLTQIDSPLPAKYFDVDVAYITKKLEEHPLIYKAQVSKKFTGVLKINLERSSPVATILAKVNNAIMPSYFDKTGRCVQVGVATGIIDVPIISGVTLVNPEVGVYLPNWMHTLMQKLSIIKQENAVLYKQISEIEIKDQGQDYRVLQITFTDYDSSFITDIDIDTNYLIQLRKFAQTVKSTEIATSFQKFDVRQGVIIGIRGDNIDE